MIRFDEGTHIYTVDGEVKRSVTQILKGAGVIDSSWVNPYYRDRGTLVHHYCVLLMQGWLSKGKVRKDCIQPLMAFERIVKWLGLTYVSAEEACYDPEYDICGTYDLIVMWNGKKTLVEIKTGLAPHWVGLQCAGYERMLDVDDVLVIELADWGKVFTKSDDWYRNPEAWEDINTGWFVLEDWKSDRKRRRMKTLKLAA